MLVSGIEVYTIILSEPEDKMPVQVIRDEGESVRPKKILISHQILYTKRKTQNQTHLLKTKYETH